MTKDFSGKERNGMKCYLKLSTLNLGNNNSLSGYKEKQNILLLRLYIGATTRENAILQILGRTIWSNNILRILPKGCKKSQNLIINMPVIIHYKI